MITVHLVKRLVVGWTTRGLVRSEQVLGRGLFTAGGLYDLGNRALGQREGAFSNAANFFMLDPATPLPDLALFANSFAHSAEEIKPGRALDNKTLTALNLGWRALTLSRRRRASPRPWPWGWPRTGAPGKIPRPPEITAQDWSAWRPYLKEGNPRPAPRRWSSPPSGWSWRSTRDRDEVRGIYHLRNPGQALAAVDIKYPILVARIDRRPPSMKLDGEDVPVIKVPGKPAEGRFTRQVPARSLIRFEIQYTQRHTGRRAVYMVTSALGWPAPISRAVFLIRHPASWGRVKLAYPAAVVSQVGEVMEHVIVQQPFIPDKEMVVRW